MPHYEAATASLGYLEDGRFLEAIEIGVKRQTSLVVALTPCGLG
jgi:hypothetical protein